MAVALFTQAQSNDMTRSIIAIIVGIALLCSTTTAGAKEPLYVVNGERATGIEHIPQEDIESIDVLPADEQTIALWGADASEGVIVVRLRYDTPAKFLHEGEDNYSDYIASKVKWGEQMEVARVSLRIKILPDGNVAITEVLQATSRQLLNRVMRAIKESPKWQAAMRNGEAIESYHLINIQLPKGEELPTERGVILL